MSQSRQNESPLLHIDLPEVVFGLADEHESGFLIHPHRHDTAQLIYATSGVMTVETDDGAWVVPTARAVWVPAFTTHSIRMTGSVQLRTLYIDPCATRPGSDDRCCVIQVSQLLQACIARLFELPTEWDTSGPQARLVAVLLDELRAAATVPLHLPLPRDPRAAKAAQAFRADPSLRKTVAEWAKVAGASERTLERLWTDELGMTFGNWQQQVRLLHALEILAAGDSVTDAALAVGFSAPSAFIAMFRRALGTTPAKYFRS